MATVYLNIGSNRGDRKENIAEAIKRIKTRFGNCNKSELVESEPWGFVSANSFYNIGLSFESEKDPLEILTILQETEREISQDSHRNKDGSYRDRVIDIDIIAIDEMEYESETLIIPHPRMQDRLFVLMPMLQLCPDWIHPKLKIDLPGLIESCNKF